MSFICWLKHVSSVPDDFNDNFILTERKTAIMTTNSIDVCLVNTGKYCLNVFT